MITLISIADPAKSGRPHPSTCFPSTGKSVYLIVTSHAFTEDQFQRVVCNIIFIVIQIISIPIYAPVIAET